MNFYNVIDKIISKIVKMNIFNNDSMVDSLNVIVFGGNVNYVQTELDYNRKIDDIFKDQIPHPSFLFLEWIDTKGIVVSANIDSSSFCRTLKNCEIQTDYLDKYQNVGIINDKYHIYLYRPLEYEIESEINGCLCSSYYDVYGEKKYIEDEIIIPDFKDFRYQKLYHYNNEEDFINAIIAEFLFRNIQHNGILYKWENEYNKCHKSEEHLEYNAEMYIIKKTNQELQKYYGINEDTFVEIQKIIDPLISKYFNPNNIGFQFKVPSSSVDVNLDLNQSLDELIKKITELKENYENELKISYRFKDKLNENYLKYINEILNSFPKTFKKKQDNLIKALYILDYVTAKDAQIDICNKRAEIKGQYLTKTLDENSVFKTEIVSCVEKPGQAKKLYYLINKILQLPKPF